MRHCNKKCKILSFVDEKSCPILYFKKTRLESEWYFVKNGEKLYPLCEDKVNKTSSKGEMLWV